MPPEKLIGSVYRKAEKKGRGKSALTFYPNCCWRSLRQFHQMLIKGEKYDKVNSTINENLKRWCRMKKNVLVLSSLIPVIVGYLVNILIMVPVIGMAGFYLFPLLTTVFWFYLGKQYARRWKPAPAVLIAHAVGICSLLIYLWQFLLETDQTRNMVLAGFSQMFSASTPLYLFGGIARLVESQPNYAGRASMVALQVIALIYMVIVFSIGLFLEKKRIKE